MAENDQTIVNKAGFVVGFGIAAASDAAIVIKTAIGEAGSRGSDESTRQQIRHYESFALTSPREKKHRQVTEYKASDC